MSKTRALIAQRITPMSTVNSSAMLVKTSCPHWMVRSIYDISRHHLLDLLSRVEHRKALTTVEKCRTWFNQLLLDIEKFKIQFNTIMNKIWQEVDVLIAPSAPCVAPLITQKDIMVNGTPVPARSHLGIFTQPFGLLGCPVLAAPIYRPGRLPLGLQLIAARGGENSLFNLAGRLEGLGITGVHAPKV